MYQQSISTGMMQGRDSNSVPGTIISHRSPKMKQINGGNTSAITTTTTSILGIGMSNQSGLPGSNIISSSSSSSNNNMNNNQNSSSSIQNMNNPILLNNQNQSKGYLAQHHQLHTHHNQQHSANSPTEAVLNKKHSSRNTHRFAVLPNNNNGVVPPSIGSVLTSKSISPKNILDSSSYKSAATSNKQSPLRQGKGIGDNLQVQTIAATQSSYAMQATATTNKSMLNLKTLPNQQHHSPENGILATLPHHSKGVNNIDKQQQLNNSSNNNNQTTICRISPKFESSLTFKFAGPSPESQNSTSSPDACTQTNNNNNSNALQRAIPKNTIDLVIQQQQQLQQQPQRSGSPKQVSASAIESQSAVQLQHISESLRNPTFSKQSKNNLLPTTSKDLGQAPISTEISDQYGQNYQQQQQQQPTQMQAAEFQIINRRSSAQTFQHRNQIFSTATTPGSSATATVLFGTKSAIASSLATPSYQPSPRASAATTNSQIHNNHNPTYKEQSDKLKRHLNLKPRAEITTMNLSSRNQQRETSLELPTGSSRSPNHVHDPANSNQQRQLSEVVTTTTAAAPPQKSSQFKVIVSQSNNNTQQQQQRILATAQPTLSSNSQHEQFTTTPAGVTSITSSKNPDSTLEMYMLPKQSSRLQPQTTGISSNHQAGGANNNSDSYEPLSLLGRSYSLNGNSSSVKSASTSSSSGKNLIQQTKPKLLGSSGTTIPLGSRGLQTQQPANESNSNSAKQFRNPTNNNNNNNAHNSHATELIPAVVDTSISEKLFLPNNPNFSSLSSSKSHVVNILKNAATIAATTASAAASATSTSSKQSSSLAVGISNNSYSNTRSRHSNHIGGNTNTTANATGGMITINTSDGNNEDNTKTRKQVVYSQLTSSNSSLESPNPASFFYRKQQQQQQQTTTSMQHQNRQPQQQLTQQHTTQLQKEDSKSNSNNIAISNNQQNSNSSSCSASRSALQNCLVNKDVAQIWPSSSQPQLIPLSLNVTSPTKQLNLSVGFSPRTGEKSLNQAHNLQQQQPANGQTLHNQSNQSQHPSAHQQQYIQQTWLRQSPTNTPIILNNQLLQQSSSSTSFIEQSQKSAGNNRQGQGSGDHEQQQQQPDANYSLTLAGGSSNHPLASSKALKKFGHMYTKFSRVDSSSSPSKKSKQQQQHHNSSQQPQPLLSHRTIVNPASNLTATSSATMTTANVTNSNFLNNSASQNMIQSVSAVGINTSCVTGSSQIHQVSQHPKVAASGRYINTNSPSPAVRQELQQQNTYTGTATTSPRVAAMQDIPASLQQLKNRIVRLVSNYATKQQNMQDLNEQLLLKIADMSTLNNNNNKND